MKSGHFFLVKRNLHRESLEKWVDIAQSMGTCEVPREGKVVYTGVFTGSYPKAKEKDNLPEIDQVFRVTLRYSDHKGNTFLFPEPDVEVYWTNRYGCRAIPLREKGCKCDHFANSYDSF